MGKGKHSTDTRGDQKGAQQHDEGQYGPKSYDAKRAEIADHSRTSTAGRAATDPNAGTGTNAVEQHDRMIDHPEFENDGKHRLFENRSQHDEAERGSEWTRRDRDIERHGHDASKVQGHEHGDDVTIRQSSKGG